MANDLATGAAGFIGPRPSEVLLTQRHIVMGVDNMNEAHAVRWTGMASGVNGLVRQ